MMKRVFVASVALFSVAGLVAFQQQYEKGDLGFDDTPMLPGQPWRVHDLNRPRPRKVTAPAACDKPVPPPSDAVVLFDGKDLSKWVQSRRGRTVEPRWKVENGYIQIVPHTGDLISKEKFGTAQYHIEWQIPKDVQGRSQSRGNSGVLLMSRYEIQVLDVYDNLTYADGGAGAIYGQWPPLVNPARAPGEWQTYDIIFEAPKFENDKLVKPAYVTVLFNGVVVHHHKEIIGRMAYRQVGTYAPHGPEEPLMLQDHNQPVRYRNIWVRRLGDYDQK